MTLVCEELHVLSRLLFQVELSLDLCCSLCVS